MYVLSARLDPADAEALERACAANGLDLELGDGEPADRPVRPDLLAAVSRWDGAPPLGRALARELGVHTIQVQPTPSATATLEAVRNGYDFVLSSPLGVHRLTSLLAYLRDVAAPTGARTVELDESDVMSTLSGSSRLTRTESAALRLLSQRRDIVVSRTELSRATGGADPWLLVNALRRQFERVGSAAQILKVPRMGFRFVGTVIERGRRSA